MIARGVIKEVNKQDTVGIGTTNPGARLEVKGSGNSSSTWTYVARNSDDRAAFMVRDDGTVVLPTFGAGTLTTDANGFVTLSSDARLKNILRDFDRGLSAVIQLTPKTYKWNEKSGSDMENEYSGFIAQDVEKAIPEAVGMDSKGYRTLSDRPIIAALVNAIKELKAQNDALEVRLKALEGK